MGGRKTSVISSWTCGLRNNSNTSVIPFSIIALPLLTLYEYTKLLDEIEPYRNVYTSIFIENISYKESVVSYYFYDWDYHEKLFRKCCKRMKGQREVLNLSREIVTPYLVMLIQLNCSLEWRTILLLLTTMNISMLTLCKIMISPLSFVSPTIKEVLLGHQIGSVNFESHLLKLSWKVDRGKI